MRTPWFLVICAALVAGGGSSSASPIVIVQQQAESIISLTTNNATATKNLNRVSNSFTAPAGVQPTSVRVFRFDSTRPPGQKWVEETGDWSCSTTGGTRPSFDCTLGAGGTPVGPGERLKFDVTFNTGDPSNIGVVRGSDKQYLAVADPLLQDSFANIVTPGGLTAMIDQAVLAGGASGMPLAGLGLTIPAGQFAYLYQLSNIASLDALTLLQIDGAASFAGFQVLASTSGLRPDVFSLLASPLDEGSGSPFNTLTLFDALGPFGVSPLDWSLVGGSAVASFAGLLAGETSNILVAFSSAAPVFSGVASGLARDGTTVVTGTVWTPVPEPATVLLLAIGLGGSAIVRRLRKRRCSAPPRCSGAD